MRHRHQGGGKTEALCRGKEAQGELGGCWELKSHFADSVGEAAIGAFFLLSGLVPEKHRGGDTEASLGGSAASWLQEEQGPGLAVGSWT